MLIFNKSVVFRQQMLFFHSNFDFYLNECTESWKINICCRKTTILLKTSNSDAMLLSASNIASWAHDDDSSRNQSKILRFSKNLDFWQFLKIDFEHHICCHGYRLSNITIWQHIGGGLCGNISATNVASPPLHNSIFICGADFFQVLIKSTIFGNKNNKCCF